LGEGHDAKQRPASFARVELPTPPVGAILDGEMESDLEMARRPWRGSRGTL